MKSKRILAVTAVCLCSTAFLTGCSLTDSLQQVVKVISGNNTTAGEDVQASSAGIEVEALIVDETLDAPVFDDTEGSLTSVMMNDPVTLSVNATVTDGGTVTYQWYSNNVDSNGGGTLIAGATESTYTPPTDDTVSVFYYAVATNTLNGKVNMSTSPCYEVRAWEEGIWQQESEEEGYRYVVQEDGSYPVSTTMTIDGVTYTFNDDGFAIDADGNYLDLSSLTGAESAAEEVAEDAAETEEIAAEEVTEEAAEETTEEPTAEDAAAAEETTEETPAE